jgi:dTDP-glucose 4,6-dehydratase
VKSLLVTGGCGFIGSHFVRLALAKTNYRVVNVDKLTYAGDLDRLADLPSAKRYRFVRGDIADGDQVDRLFSEERPYAVVNFAAESHVDRSILDAAAFLRTNVGGAHVLLDAARRFECARFVQVSTDEVYGDTAGKRPFSEGRPLTPSNPYAASKAAADLLALAYGRTHGLPVVIARACNNYGPFQFPEKLIPLIIRNALRGEPLPVYGDGLQRRSWLYVEDHALALLALLRRAEIGEIYNVGVQEERSNLDLVRTLCRLVASEGRLDFKSLVERIRFVTDRPGHDRRYALDTRKIRRRLGWAPRVSFETGLRRTVRWYLAHRDWLESVTSRDYQDYYEAVYHRGWSNPTSS